MNGIKFVRKKRRLLKKVVIIFFLFLLVNYLSNKIKIDENYLNLLTDVYIKVDSPKKEEPKDERPIAKNDTSPIIYLYNTHQSESYEYQKLTSYNIDYTVQYAAYMLSFYLEKYQLFSDVEDAQIAKILNDNNLSYAQSYKASRILLNQSIIDNPSLTYFFDIHRDAAPYDVTTCEIEGKKYARLLFVVGLEHPHYEKNLAFAQELNQKISNINSCLTRGISQKQGKGVDGIYNQDFHENTLLFEIGGNYNRMEEVDNTLRLLASVLAEYINNKGD